MSLQETNTYEKLNPPHCPKCREATRSKRCTPAPSLGKKQEFLTFECPSCRQTVTINRAAQ